MNARCDDTTGTFTYNPPAGTILPGGLNFLSVAFTPANRINWTTAFAQVSVQVGVTPAGQVKVFPVNLKTRRLDSNGDYVLGTGRDFHENTPAAVAQSCRCALLLFAGEWFADVNAGVPWATKILGKGTSSYDSIIRETLKAVPGVRSIATYSSSVDPVKRTLTVNATIDTFFGGQVSLSIPVAPAGGLPPNIAPVPAAPAAPVASMRVRKLDASGDYTLTGSKNDFWINSAAGVAQEVLTRLRLWQSTWFADLSAGLDYNGAILGKNPSKQADAILRAYILDTPGVTSITSYSSTYNAATRSLSVTATIDTLYGATTVVAGL